jgi:hypothetical protein
MNYTKSEIDSNQKRPILEKRERKENELKIRPEKK